MYYQPICHKNPGYCNTVYICTEQWQSKLIETFCIIDTCSPTWILFTLNCLFSHKWQCQHHTVSCTMEYSCNHTCTYMLQYSYILRTNAVLSGEGNLSNTYLEVSLVPRPRPAFCHFQYGKAGRTWYLLTWVWCTCSQKMVKICRTNRLHFRHFQPTTCSVLSKTIASR